MFGKGTLLPAPSRWLLRDPSSSLPSAPSPPSIPPSPDPHPCPAPRQLQSGEDVVGADVCPSWEVLCSRGEFKPLRAGTHNPGSSGMGKFRFPWVGGGVFFLSPPPPGWWQWLFRAGVLRGEGRISRLIRRFLSTPGAAADQHRKPRELGSGGGEGWERWERPSGKRESAQVRAGAPSTTFWVRRDAGESLPFPSQHREIPLGNV